MDSIIHLLQLEHGFTTAGLAQLEKCWPTEHMLVKGLFPWAASILRVLIYLRIIASSAFAHPRRPRGSQSGRGKRRDESFQVRAKEPFLPTRLTAPGSPRMAFALQIVVFSAWWPHRTDSSICL